MGLDLDKVVITYYRYLLIIALIILIPSFEGLFSSLNATAAEVEVGTYLVRGLLK